MAKLSNNPTFAPKLLNYIVSRKDGFINFDSFEQIRKSFITANHKFMISPIVEIFVKEPEQYKLTDESNYIERVEIFVLISLERYDLSKGEVADLKINYSDSIMIVKVVDRF